MLTWQILEKPPKTHNNLEYIKQDNNDVLLLDWVGRIDKNLIDNSSLKLKKKHKSAIYISSFLQTIIFSFL